MPTSSSAFAGLRFSYAFPLRDSIHSPLMKFLKIRGATAVAILPPQTIKLAALLFVRSYAGLNARHFGAETKFYRRLGNSVKSAPSSSRAPGPRRQIFASLNLLANGGTLMSGMRRPVFRG